MSTLFVTGAGTGLGKTLLSCSIVRELKRRRIEVRALKPVVTGFEARDAAESDSGRLLDALGLPVETGTLDRISPWRFRAPLSPDMAAAREQRSIPFTELVGFCRSASPAGVTIVEGVGGVMVPLDAERTVLDWIAALDCVSVLVTGSYLGAISHTLTALGALTGRGLPVRGIVISESTDQPVPVTETARVIERFSSGIPVHVLPRLGRGADAPPFAERLGLTAAHRPRCR